MCVDGLARHLHASETGGACHEESLNHNPGKPRYTTLAMSVQPDRDAQVLGIVSFTRTESFKVFKSDLLCLDLEKFALFLQLNHFTIRLNFFAKSLVLR